ncbi:MAG: glycoside hydrolase family 2 protein [Saprospiraceae bacterium]|nr:glycoside hydrolase family 2 protein [Saprospiraceae bacterium]
MFRNILVLAFLLPMLLQAQPVSYTPVRKPLPTDAWTFRQAHTNDWKPTAVPVSVHTALLKNGMIEDPFYRDNEEKLQWIEKEDWEFQTTFDVEPAIFQKKHIELVFKGIDTYAHIYVNDSLVLETDNMFRTWDVDVKKWLKPTGNVLHIYFESPLKKVEEDWKNLGYELPGGIRTFSRKAQFHYGWDWGPRFVGAGILHAPEIRAWDDLLIENMFVTTQSVTPELAKMVARFRYRADDVIPVLVSTRDGKGVSLEDRKFYPGVHEDSVTWQIENPKLWWCQGLGEPNLYDFSLEFKKNGRVLEKSYVRTGIRTIELITDKDDKGETFYFKLNGVPVFIKGANYIPQDIFQDRVTPAQYGRTINDAVASGMNMLRVWGGGIYEDDLFYDLCDAKGIMVWQDFMYACAMYPGGGSFLKTAAKEALQQIERLRQHPCIALWCGNNENNEAWNNWGWQMQFNEAQRTHLWREYKILFNDLLPTYVANDGGQVPYWESSPRFGRANPKSNTEGDSHYWGIWHDEEPFEEFNKKVPRFMSEYGFQSFPEWRTIQSFTLPEDRKLESKVMLLHQKHPRGNALIAEYMKRDYKVPDGFEDFVYVSQLLQAEGMRVGIEAHRRNKPYCMGTLYWQLNDVWPVASWSSIDCFGRWKALHYYVREAYSPLAALPLLDNDTLSIYGVNDHLQADTVDLRVRGLLFDGKVLSETTLTGLSLRPDASMLLWKDALKNVVDGRKVENVVVEIMLSKGGKTLYRRLYYPASPRKQKLPHPDFTLTATRNEKGYQIDIQSDKLARNVLIETDSDGFFSDNYFDLLPDERKSIQFDTKAELDVKNAFRVKSLVDTMH